MYYPISYNLPAYQFPYPAFTWVAQGHYHTPPHLIMTEEGHGMNDNYTVQAAWVLEGTRTKPRALYLPHS